MKYSLIVLLTFCLTAPGIDISRMPQLDFDPPPRREITLPGTPLTLWKHGKADLEIVVLPEAGTVAAFAAEELQIFLQKAGNVEIPIRNSRGEAHTAIVLGEHPDLKKMGLNLGQLTRDAFYLRTEGNNIYIAGIDDKNINIPGFLVNRGGEWRLQCYFQRGTLFGVYDFLERFLRVRFYFSGEMGTFIPPCPELSIPRLERMDRPDFRLRNTTWLAHEAVTWYDQSDNFEGSNRNYLRWRLQTAPIPNCHGLAGFGYLERFAETKPEYFAVLKNGKRSTDPNEQHPGQLCLSNPQLRKEILEDAKSALRGEPASKRGVVLSKYGTSMWTPSGYYPGFFNVMPQDGFQPCQCPDCQKYFAAGNGTELIWEMTAEIASAIQEAGIPGYITQMGYDFYARIPKVSLPDNVLVMYATMGPWGKSNPGMQNKAREEIQGWCRKIQKKVWLWNYMINDSRWPGHQAGPKGVPHFTPRTAGKYFQSFAGQISGAFLECETDHYLWGALNMYTAARVFWDNGVNVDQIVDEFYQNMFGKAAPQLKQFLDSLEETWVSRINGNVVDLPTGPTIIKATRHEIWNQIYTPEILKNYQKWFQIAEQNAAGNDMTAKRIAFFKELFLLPMLRESESNQAMNRNLSELTISALPSDKTPVLDGKIAGDAFWEGSQEVFFRPLQDQPCDLRIQIRARSTEDCLWLAFSAQEPEIKLLKKQKHPAGSMKIFEDALLEVFLNPSGDRKKYFQVCVNPQGSTLILEHPEQKVLPLEITAKTVIDEQQWSAEIAIPKTLLLPAGTNPFPANFSYSRQLNTDKEYNHYYTWSYLVKTSFHEIENFGNLIFTRPPNDNLLLDNDFNIELSGYRAGAWIMPYPKDPDFAGVIELDQTTFISGGKSLHLKMTAGRRLDAVQDLLLEAGCDYELSYYVKYDIKPEGAFNVVVHAGKNFFLPPVTPIGKLGWHRELYPFRTAPADLFNGKAALRFCIVKPGAEVWIDKVKIRKIQEHVNEPL